MYTRAIPLLLSLPRRRLAVVAAALAVTTALTLAAAHADTDHDGSGHKNRTEHELTSQDRAIRLRESGAILPLVDIIRLSGVERAGKVIGVELETEDGHPVYELKVLTEEGRVREYHIDPSNGRILEVD
ncbi:putative membrane protein YkoI [Breoghania corrubedonensis]|uniref:Putative membrane protein YkoI n=1 Tax=Breoghania corrubedonensis TaxID=665038 RepID=A0A2T5V7K3_9HYPH|nr:PepSY domain-containing protein [Breoghania corrubedonensis]PTW59723.1 putative membrane protein YkoI [Breoghania corrubedonensis]